MSGEEEEGEKAEKTRRRTQMSRAGSSKKGTLHLKHSTGDLQDPQKSEQLAKTLKPFHKTGILEMR